MIDNNTLKDIEAKANIVDVVSSFVDLQKKGRNYWGICPFHDDTSPSMSVSPDKKMYKCFTCGAGGGAINFVKEFENIPFPQAVVKVAEMVGMDTSKMKANTSVKRDEKAEKIYEINRQAADFYSLSLASNDGKEAMAYLTGRKISKEEISKYEIGYSSKSSSLVKFLTKKGFESKDIIEAGLANLKDGEIYDIFVNRVMFTIKNEWGKVVGFSGRSLSKNPNFAKYVNTRETHVFKKNRILYNIDNAAKEARKTKELYVCEGFTDVMAMDKAGFKNTVAIMGTALTVEHAKVISKSARSVAIVLDGDNAGVKAAFKSLETLNQTKLERSVISLPRKTDVDEIFQKDGIEGVKKALSKKFSWMKFEIGFLKYQFKDDKPKMTKSLIKRLEFISDAIEKDLYISEIEKATGLSRELIAPKQTNSYQPQQSNYQQPPVVEVKPYVPTRLPRELRTDLSIISMVLDSKTALELYKNSDWPLKDQASRTIMDYIIAYNLDSTEEIREKLDSKNDKILNRLRQIDEQVEKPFKKYNKDVFDELLENLEKRR